MAKRVRKKTKAELAAPAFRNRALSQSEVLTQSYAECKRLSKARHQFVLDVANYEWMNRFPYRDDENALAKEDRNWERLLRDFVKTANKPLEIHCFTCNYDASRGMKPLLQLVKNAFCDAGTALRLFWVNDPVYYSQYTSITDCPYPEEQDSMRLLRAIKRRFKRNDFSSRKVFFDPAPWIAADDVDLRVLDLPDSMHTAVSKLKETGG
jgi:hypothetical protein